MRSCNLAAGALAALVVTALGLGTAVSQSTSRKPHFGKPISQADLAAWDIDIRTSDGKGLPQGKGTVAEGKALFAQQCVACHGDAAKGGPMYGSMVGGIGSFTTNARVLTPGSMYPYAPILFDYIRRTMPMTAPQSLTNDQVYALSAYILNLNGLIAENAVMDAASLTKVMMPNRNGFVVDNRPDTTAKRCMANC
ncbi:MAG: cytochrome c [Proteobacteria bacterium]|nr:cytochrome c [Pseudomonadota bacterium]